MRSLRLLIVLLACAPALARADAGDEMLAAASALFDAHKYADAAQKLDAFLAAYPQHARAGAAALALGRCRAELKQFDKAIPAYEKVVSGKDAALVPLGELGLGEAALSARQYEKAATALNAALKAKLKPEQQLAANLWLGQADFQLQRYADARAAYEEVIRTDSRRDYMDDALYGSGLSSLKLGDTGEARRRLGSLVDGFPKSDDRAPAMVTLGRMDLQAKNWQQARADFERLLNEAPNAPDATRSAAEEGLAQALLELGDDGAAIPRLQAIIARLPQESAERAHAELSLGNCCYRQKQYDRALAAYTEAAGSREAAIASQGLYWSGNACLELNHPADAATHFQALVARYPKDELAAKAQLKAADALAAAKQTDAASKAYQAVVTNYPQSPQAEQARTAMADLVVGITDPAQLAAAIKTAPPAARAAGALRLARIYLQQKRYTDAQIALTNLLMSGPAQLAAAEANYLLGCAYEAQDKSVPAEVSLSEAVRLGASAAWMPDAQGRLAWVYLDLKKPDRAEAAANNALAAKLDPAAQEQARLALVQAQLQEEKWDAAYSGCQALLAANPGPNTVAAVLFAEGWASDKRGKPAEAEAAWSKLVADHPRSEYTAQALLRMGDARLKAEEFDEAREKYAALLSGFPTSPFAPEAGFKLGSALFNGGKAQEAAVQFDSVAANKAAGDYGPESLYWAGVAYDKAGKKTEAIDRLTRLVTDYPKHPRVATARIRLAALKAVNGGQH